MDLINFLISSSNSAVAAYRQKSTNIKRSDYNGIQEYVIMDDSNEELSQHSRRIFRNKFIEIRLVVKLRFAIFIKKYTFYVNNIIHKYII